MACHRSLYLIVYQHIVGKVFDESTESIPKGILARLTTEIYTL